MKEKKKGHHYNCIPQPAYFPNVYLSIVVSGLPPGNNIKLILHNQRVDQRDLSHLL